MGLVQHYPALNRPEKPACSVCIANYNGIDLLADCLDSVFGQNCDFIFEVIVHDDASPDASVPLLRERYPQVEILASQENVGFCISNNRMVDHARGEYILLLNNDAALFPDALATFLMTARTQTSPGILTLPQYDWATGDLVDRGCLLDPFYNPIPNLDPLRTDVATAIGACLWIPRRLWNDLGGFPEWLESIAEDIYLCCFARSIGCSVQTLLHSGFRHRLGASFGGARIERNSLNTTIRRRRLSERNKTFVLAIFTPTAMVWVLLAIHLTALLIEGALVSLLRRNLRIFRDIYAGVPLALLRQRKVICTLRRSVQTRRTASFAKYYATFSILPRKVALLLRFGIPKIS